MGGFIDAFMEYSSELESPRSFFLWSAYTVVGAAARDNCYLSQGPKRIYPNIYTLLLADSAISRKGTAPNIVYPILKDVRNTKIIRGRSSIQAIISDLAEGGMDSKTGELKGGGSCLLIADELASFLVQDPAAVPILTDIYDFYEEWESNLKGAGKIKIRNMCVSLLAASNETHLREVYTNLAIYGGLLGRTFFVKSDGQRPPNPLFFASGEEQSRIYDKSPLVDKLRQVTQIKGEFKISREAANEYINWYQDLYTLYTKRTDKSGIVARIHTGVVKVAEILALGNDLSLEITRAHVEEAIYSCTNLLPNYELFVMSSGKSDISNAGAVLFEELYRNETLSRKAFLRKFWQDIDPDILDKTATTLEQAGFIKINVSRSDTDYMITEAGKQVLEEKQKRGNKE